MNPKTLREALELLNATKKTSLATRKVNTVIAPPIVFLQPLATSTRAKRLQFAAQNVHFKESGPQVGEVSAVQVKDVGASYVLLGHSARRHDGETDEDVSQKIMTVLASKLIPVVFVGEQDRDENGNFLNVVRKQIKIALGEVPYSRVKDIILCYEPVWAISTNKLVEEITTKDIHQMMLFVHKVLVELFGATVARKVKILYGGSVNEINAEEIFNIPGVSGAAVGGASLDAEKFSTILKVANKA